MAEEKVHVHVSESVGAAEIKERGLFDVMGRPKEDELVIVNEFEKAEDACDKNNQEKSTALLDKLHRSDSSSSGSSSEEEEEDEDDGKKKDKKKKGLREKIKFKISGEKEEDDTTVPIERVDDTDEQKGFLDRIKEKLPGAGGHPKKAEDSDDPKGQEVEAVKGKKGILEKIKEKLPGYNRNGAEENANH